MKLTFSRIVQSGDEAKNRCCCSGPKSRLTVVVVRLAASKGLLGRSTLPPSGNVVDSAEMVEDSMIGRNGIKTLCIAALGMTLSAESLAPCN